MKFSFNQINVNHLFLGFKTNYTNSPFVHQFEFNGEIMTENTSDMEKFPLNFGINMSIVITKRKL